MMCLSLSKGLVQNWVVSKTAAVRCACIALSWCVGTEWTVGSTKPCKVGTEWTMGSTKLNMHERLGRFQLVDWRAILCPNAMRSTTLLQLAISHTQEPDPIRTLKSTCGEVHQYWPWRQTGNMRLPIAFCMSLLVAHHRSRRCQALLRVSHDCAWPSGSARDSNATCRIRARSSHSTHGHLSASLCKH